MRASSRASDRQREEGAASLHLVKEPIDAALARAPDLHAAAETIAQAWADLTTASLLPNPVLIPSTMLQHLPGGQFTAQNPGGPPQYNVDVAEPIDGFLFGKRAAAIESARLAVDVSGADFDDLKRQLRGDVAPTTALLMLTPHSLAPTNHSHP